MALDRPEQWRKVKEVFDAALRRDAHLRTTFLDEACADDGATRAEVASLLRSHDAAPGFIEMPAWFAAGVPDPAQSVAAALPQTVGAYRLVRPIAVGGMGAVYAAVRADDVYRKEVAVKFLRPDRFLAPPQHRDELLERFRAERQTLATLDHPNIARLLDGGTTDDGLPYLVMEYVEGRPIDEFAESCGLSVAERIRLFQRVCAAVHYAHQHLVVHRDLKPGNILVTADRTPKLLDFGIAKLLTPDPSAAGDRATALPAMTFDYASPEQIRGARITTATDVYAAGVILYELLAGRRPFSLSEVVPHEAVRLVCEVDPPPPSAGAASERLRRRLAGDLDMIVMKALRKEPERRYGSVEQLSEDLERHLTGRTVGARPDTVAYRVSKFVRRHALGVVVTALTVIMLAAAAVVANGQRVEALRQLRAANAVTGFLTDEVLSAPRPEQMGREVTMREVIERASDQLDGRFEDMPLVEATIRDTLGEALVALGDLDGAVPHVVRALELRTAVLGEEHAETLDALGTLTVIRRRQGRLEEAEALGRRALEIRRRTLGDDDPATLRSINNLATVLRFEGKLDEAEPLALEAFALSRRVLDPVEPGWLMCEYNIAELRSAQGRDEDAAAIYASTVAHLRELQHGGDWWPQYAGEFLCGYGECLTRLGRFAEAEPLLLEAHEALSKALGEADARTQRAARGLVVLGERRAADGSSSQRER